MSTHDESEFATTHRRRLIFNDLNLPQRPTHLSSPNQQEIEDPNNQLFEELSIDSGKLNISGKWYKILDGNVHEEEENNVGKMEHLNKLGEGSFGTVSRIKFGEILVAEKEMYLKPQNIPHLRELKVMQKCVDCPQIVDFYGYVINKMKVSIYMELMDTSAAKILDLRQKAANLTLQGPTNFHYNTGFPEKIISKIALGITTGLNYLKNKHRTIHRDLHLGNILLDCRGNIKLCDFGIAGKLNDNSLMETFTRGCLEYLAPERLREGMDENKKYGAPADVWSLGIVLVHLARGTNPYMTKPMETSLELMIHMINTDSPCLNWFECFSFEFREFVEKCLQKETEKRPRYVDILEDKFIKMGEKIGKFYIARWVNEQLNLLNTDKNKNEAKKVEFHEEKCEEDKNDKNSSGDSFESDFEIVSHENGAKKIDHQINESNFGFIEEISKSSFGTVNKCKIKNPSISSSKFVTIKEISQKWPNCMKELEILSQCKHKNIVKYLGHYKNDEKICIVMEFLEGENLSNFLLNYRNKLNIGKALDILLQIIRGMNYLHSKGFLHQDLAARNCMISNGHIKIIDFGLSQNFDLNGECEQDETTMFHFVWTALECLTGGKFTPKSDVWSFGILMWEIFARQKPHAQFRSVNELIETLMKGQRLKKPDFCPPEIYKLMQLCWDKNQEKRPSFEDLWVEVQRIVLKLDEKEETNDFYKGSSPVKAFRVNTNVSGLYV